MRNPATAGPTTRLAWADIWPSMIAFVRRSRSMISAVMAMRAGARIEMVDPPITDATTIIQ